MDLNEISQIVKEIIAEICEIEIGEIKDNANLMEDLEIDSLAALEILATIEKKCSIKIPEEDLERFTTVEQIVGVTAERLSVKA